MIVECDNCGSLMFAYDSGGEGAVMTCFDCAGVEDGEAGAGGDDNTEGAPNEHKITEVLL